MCDKVYNILTFISRKLMPIATVIVGLLESFGVIDVGGYITAVCAALVAIANILLDAESQKFFESHEIVEKTEE